MVDCSRTYFRTLVYGVIGGGDSLVVVGVVLYKLRATLGRDGGGQRFSVIELDWSRCHTRSGWGK